jgi:hypothetical protein
MALSDPHSPERHDASSTFGAAALAAGAFVASLLLVAPIVLWARFGTAGALWSAIVAASAVALCWALIRRTRRRYTRRRLPSREPLRAAVPPACPTGYRTHSRHVAAPSRDRRVAAPHRCGPSRCRPAYVSRGARDIGCHASPRLLRRRTTRRRTRP